MLEGRMRRRWWERLGSVKVWDGIASLWLGCIRVRSFDRAIARRARTLNRTRSGISWRPSVAVIFKVPVVLATLFATASHAHITSNTHTATLFSDNAAERGTGSKTRKLLGAVNLERGRFDLEPKVQKGLGSSGFARWGEALARRHGRVFIQILSILDFFVQVEVEAIESFMANRQIGEDEVASLRRAIQIGNAGDRDSSQDGAGRRLAVNAAVGDGTGIVEGCEQKEVGIVSESNVGLVHVIFGVGFENAQLHDRWRIDGTTVGGGCQYY
jgi:hypothetical protein